MVFLFECSEPGVNRETAGTAFALARFSDLCF